MKTAKANIDHPHSGGRQPSQELAQAVNGRQETETIVLQGENTIGRSSRYPSARWQ